MISKSQKKTISITVSVWRQARNSKEGQLVDYQVNDIPIDASFLEMLDILNETLVED